MIEAFNLRTLLDGLADELAAVTEQIKSINRGEAHGKPSDRDRRKLISSASGSISKQMVVNSTPLSKPSATDMNKVVGLCHSAISPPTGEASAAAPAIAIMVNGPD